MTSLPLPLKPVLGSLDGPRLRRGHRGQLPSSEHKFPSKPLPLPSRSPNLVAQSLQEASIVLCMARMGERGR